ncbi:hypothetical protein [Treponema pedis]
MQIALSKNAVEFAFRQTSGIVCRFSLHYETAENKQSSEFENSCGCLFYREVFMGFIRTELKKIFVCIFTVLFFALSAEQMYSPSWGYSLDLPEGFGLTQHEGSSRYLFQHSVFPVDLHIALYKKEKFENVQKTSEHIFSQFSEIKLTHKDIPFLWRNKTALLSNVDFMYSPSKDYKPKELLGWLLILELPDNSGWLVLFSYSDKKDSKNCEPVIISALDSVFTDIMSYLEPGPVTAALYPKTGEKEINYTFNNKKIKFTVDNSDAEANRSVIDREFKLLTSYLNNPNLTEAWKRYYRIIFRDAWSRIYPASAAIQSAFSFYGNEGAEKASKELLLFVQDFKYERNHQGSDFLNLPEAFLEKRGDCDSRALLMVLILKQMNIDAVLLVSGTKSHALAGTDCGGSGACFTHNGKNYLLGETTAHVPIGEIAEEMSNPEDWFAVDFYIDENSVKKEAE